jgi:hypothetical protein
MADLRSSDRKFYISIRNRSAVFFKLINCFFHILCPVVVLLRLYRSFGTDGNRTKVQYEEFYQSHSNRTSSFLLVLEVTNLERILQLINKDSHVDQSLTQKSLPRIGKFVQFHHS